MRSQRIEQIAEFIRRERNVTLDDICASFNISKSTLRRDLKDITRDGGIRKIYGGVTTEGPSVQRPFEERHVTNPGAKSAIGEEAAKLVDDGDVIFIDTGTTTMYMADFLAHRQNLTIITNNIEVIRRALPFEHIAVICLSGHLNRKLLSFTGGMAVTVLQNYNITKAFMATAGVSLEFGVTHSFFAELEIKQTAVARSQKIILLADSSKLGKVSLHTYCPLDHIHTLVTDTPPPGDYRAAMAENGAEILVAPKGMF